MTRRPSTRSLAAAWLAVALVGCELLGLTPTPTPSASGTPAPTPSPSATPDASQDPSASARPTPEPPHSLATPASVDSRVVSVTVTPQLAAGESGELLVVVTSHTDTIVGELVLRWPTDVETTVFFAPFEPSQQRIREGGPPLYQEWTKWVVGPGESGEPAGTTSLGWGPLLPGATLEIPILANRVASTPIAFDLQVLAGEAILTLDSGDLAELRIGLP